MNNKFLKVERFISYPVTKHQQFCAKQTSIFAAWFCPLVISYFVIKCKQLLIFRTGTITTIYEYFSFFLFWKKSIKF